MFVFLVCGCCSAFPFLSAERQHTSLALRPQEAATALASLAEISAASKHLHNDLAKAVEVLEQKRILKKKLQSFIERRHSATTNDNLAIVDSCILFRCIVLKSGRRHVSTHGHTIIRAACGKGFISELSCRNDACRTTVEQGQPTLPVPTQAKRK